MDRPVGRKVHFVDYAYKRVGTEGFGETIEAVRRAVATHGFVIQEFHDIQGRLAAKGFPINPLVILEVAPADEKVDSDLALIMPCRIHVYEEAGSVVVAVLRPTLFAAVFPEHELDTMAEEIERVVVRVVDDSVDPS